MKEIFIHAGIHKTGSTSIQMSLAGFDDGVSFYADLTDTNHSLPFQTKFSDDHLSEHWTRLGISTADELSRTDSSFDGMLEQLESRDRVILSGENISLFSTKDLQKIKDFFASRFSCQFRILMMIRPPVDWMPSMIQEEIKHGAIFDSEKKYGIYERYRNLKCVFENGVEVLDYDSVCSQGGDVVTRFCEVAGISLPRTDRMRVNQSLLEMPLKLVHLFNRSAVPTYNGQTIYMSKWRFISRLNSIFDGSRQIQKKYFSCFIDRSDFAQMYGTIGKNVQIDPCSFEDFSSYIGDIDESFARKEIVTHLSTTGFPFNKSSTLPELLQVLYLFELFEAGRAFERTLRNN